jgi:hypothetical protein
VFQIRGGQLRQITNDHTIGMLAWSADLLALVLARHPDGRRDRRADMGLRADARCLLFTGGLSPVLDDRPHRNVLISRRFYRGVDQLTGLLVDRASVSLLTPTGVRASCMRAKPAPGSHCLPAMRARRSAAIPGTRNARRHVRRHLRARCAQAYWRTIAVTMCPGKSGHK